MGGLRERVRRDQNQSQRPKQSHYRTRAAENGTIFMVSLATPSLNLSLFHFHNRCA
jgi:hypothetical protein